MLDLSLIVPCYNEGKHLAESVAEVNRVLAGSQLSYEIMLVDDGSIDGTRDLILGLCRDDSSLRCILHETNKGRGAAFKTGFANTSGRVTGFIDIDLEVHALYIPYLVSLISARNLDVVTGHRFYVLQTGYLHRHFLSHSYRWLINKIIGFDIRDSETGCKFFNRATAGTTVMASESNGWFWDTEVMMRAVLSNLKILEWPVLFVRRADKQSTVRLLPDMTQYLKELIRIRPRLGLSYLTKSPIYWTTWGYDLALSLLLGTDYRKIFADVAAIIEPGSSVVDLCAGTGRLYRDFLKGSGCSYIGLDFNSDFVMALRHQGIDARHGNLLTIDELPRADYVVMCSSMHQFHGAQDELLDKMKRAAKRMVIISEPVQNLSQHRIKWFARIANRLTNPGVGRYDIRFDLKGFREFAERNAADRIVEGPDNRIAIALFGTASLPSSAAEDPRCEPHLRANGRA